MTKAPEIDPWSYYDYKAEMDKERGPYSVPSWMGDNARRVRAYMWLDSLYRTSAREWLDKSVTDYEDLKKSRREYGDPFIIVQTYLSSLLGDDQTIVVPAATEKSPPAGSKELLEKLTQWSTDDKFLQKLIESERNAVKFGDSVIVVEWDDVNERPTLSVWEPGMYFPVLDPRRREEFPRKIHLAYEYEEVDSRGRKSEYLRRITWELVDTKEDDRLDEKTYTHKWNAKPTTFTVLYTDATWDKGEFRGNVYDLSMDKAEFEETNGQEDRDRDLGIDFIPVIHIPNNVAGAEHFGTSVLANVSQLCEDLASTDTDLQASSRITGSPPIGVSGVGIPVDDQGRIAAYGPGSVFQTGEGGMTILDTSNSLDALIKYSDHQLKRLAVNSRIPESLLGRIKPSEVPSGITLTLSFTPHSAAVKEMRLVREDKNGLELKFVTRFFMMNDSSVAFHPANVAYGSFLPADKKEAVDLVRQLYQADAGPLISLETAVRILINAGFPIDDAADEVNRIVENDFESANKMLDATGDVNLVRNRLGLPPLETSTAPPPDTGEGTGSQTEPDQSEAELAL